MTDPAPTTPDDPPADRAEEPLHLPARPYSAGRQLLLIGLAALSLLFMGGGCVIGPLLAELLQGAVGQGAALVAMLGSSCGLPVLSLLVFVALLRDAHQHYREARLYAEGVRFGPSPLGGETKLRWSEVQSFRGVADGLVLRRKGRRGVLPRWLGPRLLCEGETMHRVIVLLEAQGVFAEDA